MKNMKKTTLIYLFATILLLLIPLSRIALNLYNHPIPVLVDFTSYCAISRALFEGNNPFPDHQDVLFRNYNSNNIVPIVYPGQMLFFVIPAYIWGNAIQLAYILLNVAVIFLLTSLTLVKACGYQWRDLWIPGKKQLFFAFCISSFLLSNCFMEALHFGQISLILTMCIYGMFWKTVSRYLRILLFAFIAVAKYSILPVIAPILFFKGHWKLCIAAFSLFIFLSITPAFFGNNLVDVYTEYFKAVRTTFQPGNVNHYGSTVIMCHLGFFKIPILNHILKAIVVCFGLWLFWREHKTKYVSDMLMLLAFNLTLLISYHKTYDLSLLFPLFFIRLFDFAKTKRWCFFGFTALFTLLLDIPRTISYLTIPSYIGKIIPKLESITYVHNHPWGTHYTHVFPIMPFFTIALTICSLYLYFHIKEPYRFEITEA